jgi:hypothetical protein
VDFPKPWGSATSPVSGGCGDVSGAKLSRSPLLFQIERRRGQCPSATYSSPWGFGGAGGPPRLQRMAAAAKVEEVSGE